MYRLSPSGRLCCSGPCTKSGLLLAGALGLSIACSSDEDPDDGGLGGAGGGTSHFDASVPHLPGDGREETPESDTSDREVPFLPSDEFIDSVIDVGEAINGGQSGARDASASDAATGDAGPDGST